MKLRNTTQETQTVELLITGMTPEMDTIERTMTTFYLAGNATRIIPIAIHDLPVQSSGNAGAMRIVARYSPSGTEASAPKFMVFTEPLMVTFDDDFKAAMVRSPAEQVQFNSLTADSRILLETKGEVRLKDARNGAFAARAASSSNIRRGPVVMLAQLPFPIDYKNAERAPETEPSPGGEQ